MSGFFENGITAIGRGDIDLLNDNIHAILVDIDQYTVDLNTHSTLGDIPEDSILAEQVLTGKTLDGTTFRADNTTFPNVPSGPNVGALIIFRDSGVLTTSYLMTYFNDTSELPITPDGTDITVEWNTGVNGIFKL